MPDQFTEALNAPSGRLAEILLKKLTRTDDGGEMSEEMQARFEKLIRAEGQFGDLARVRLAADVPFLFDRSPSSTGLLPTHAPHGRRESIPRASALRSSCRS
jgi:hypothetical protein